jgi:c-di-GMP-binding flagellar brake protein YcgR
MDGSEKRVHARAQIEGEVRVSGPGGVETGKLVDISKGGAGVLLPAAVGTVGETVEIFIEFHESLEIAVMAEIQRVKREEQGFFVGVRFNLVEPAMQKRLVGLIEHLLVKENSEADGKRQHTRVAHRLPVTYGKLADLKAMIQNISMGGLAMTVDEPLVLYEQIEVTIPEPSGRDLLLLNGEVMNQHPIEQDGKTRYRIGIKFKDLSPIAKECLKTFLAKVTDVSSSK